MIETLAEALGVSAPVVWALAVLVVLQLSVQAWALVDLARRPRVRYEHKWIWVLVIVFLGNSFIGPILYVAFGRTVPEEVDVPVPGASPGAGEGDRTREAVDTLYGDSERR